MTTLVKIPLDTLRLITASLDYSTLNACRLSCRHLSAAVEGFISDEHYWKLRLRQQLTIPYGGRGAMAFSLMLEYRPRAPRELMAQVAHFNIPELTIYCLTTGLCRPRDFLAIGGSQWTWFLLQKRTIFRLILGDASLTATERIAFLRNLRRQDLRYVPDGVVEESVMTELLSRGKARDVVADPDDLIECARDLPRTQELITTSLMRFRVKTAIFGGLSKVWSDEVRDFYRSVMTVSEEPRMYATWEILSRMRRSDFEGLVNYHPLPRYLEMVDLATNSGYCDATIRTLLHRRKYSILERHLRRVASYSGRPCITSLDKLSEIELVSPALLTAILDNYCFLTPEARRAHEKSR